MRLVGVSHVPACCANSKMIRLASYFLSFLKLPLRRVASAGKQCFISARLDLALSVLVCCTAEGNEAVSLSALHWESQFVSPNLPVLHCGW